MPRDLPSLNGIRAFEAAARHENFSRAADELNVTQSAISRHIQNLETQLGQSLFRRNGPRLTLTAAGRAYFEVVQEGLGVIRRGTDRLFRSDPRPILTLSLLPSLTMQWFVPRLADFKRLHPAISLRLDPSYGLTDFSVNRDIDAAIRLGKGRWPGVAAELILDDVLVVVASPAVARRLEKPADVLTERLLVEDPHWDLWNVWMRAAGIREPPRRPDRLSDDTNVQIQTAILGHGLALAPGMLVADGLRQGRLVCPFQIAVRSPVQYYFVCPPERMREEAIRTVREWMQQAAAETVAGMTAIWGEPVRAD